MALSEHYIEHEYASPALRIKTFLYRQVVSQRLYIIHTCSLRLLIIPHDTLFIPPAGERLIQYASENLVTEILIHPQTNTFIQCMRNLLSSFTRHRHIIHAGYTFTGNGSWILQVSFRNHK